MQQVIIIFLQFRLYLFNTFFNKIPSKHLRLWISKLHLKIGNNSSIRSNLKLLNLKQRNQIVIGKNTIINQNCLFDGRKGRIIIGNNVSISRDVQIYTLQHNVDCDYFSTVAGDVTIEDYVWIGARVIILPGVKIGKGAVVASGAVVTKNIESMSMCGGIPAKHIKFRQSKLLYTLIDKQKFQ